jgi:trigger factor
MSKGFKKKAPTKGQLIEHQGKQLDGLSKQNNAMMQSFMQIHQNVQNINNEVGALSQLLRMSEVTDVAKKGDAVMIDFIGFLKKEDGTLEKFPFPGGHNQGHVLLYLGDGKLLPEFEASLEGKKVGDSYELDFTFPEDYQAENLKGKETQFTVQVIKIWRHTMEFKVKDMYDKLVAEAQEEARKKQEEAKKAAEKVQKAADDVKQAVSEVKEVKAKLETKDQPEDKKAD